MRIVWLPESGATTPKRGFEKGSSQHFVHIGVAEEADAHAPVLDRQVGRPEPFGLDPLLDAPAELARAGGVATKVIFVGDDLLGDDGSGALPDLVDLGTQGGAVGDGQRCGFHGKFLAARRGGRAV